MYVSNFNFWLKEEIRNVKNPFCRFSRDKKSLKLITSKKLNFQPIFEFKSMVLGRKSWFSENPQKTEFLDFRVRKNVWILIFWSRFFFLEKYITSAPKSYKILNSTYEISNYSILSPLLAVCYFFQAKKPVRQIKKTK